MRILLTGLMVFVIWSFFSTWLYTDVLRHAAKPQVTVLPAAEPINAEADSLARLYAMMPKDLTVYFEFDRLRILTDPSIEAGLPEFKNWLDKYPGSTLAVTGYTDLVGENAYNDDLGLERARAVSRLLEEKGFPASRIITSSKGENEPVAGYITPEGRAKNRRVVISVKM